MTLPALPAEGSTSWYPWATGIHAAAAEVTSGRLTAEALTAASRSLASATTASLATDASATLTIPLAVGFRLYSIQTSIPARVRLYATAARQAADAGRSIGVDPASDAGVLFDFVTVDTSTHSLSPLVDGANLEASPSATIPMTVTHKGNVVGPVTVTFSYIKTE